MNNDEEATGASEPAGSVQIPDEQKPYWHCFWPLSPPPPDDEEVKLLASVRMTSEYGWNWHVSLLGRGKIIDVLGVSVPAHFMRTGEPYQELVGRALSRAFAAVSMVYSSNVKLLTFGEEFVSVGMFSEDEVPRLYPLQFSMPPTAPPNWDPQSLLTFIAHDELPADAVGALSEALRREIPRHYRFLALCRALELLIPIKREQSQWLEGYEEEFRALNVDPKRFRNYLPQLRNRCAHGLVGPDRAIFGLAPTGLPTGVFDLLLKAVINKLNETPGITIVPPTVPSVGEPRRLDSEGSSAS